MQNKNLNIEFIHGDDGKDWKRLKEFKKDNFTIHFTNIEEALIKYISKANTCLGCVAWLTNEKILNALGKCEIVSIIVQKEDFLRPDELNMQPNWKENHKSWKTKLRQMYDDLPPGVSSEHFIYFDAFNEELTLFKLAEWHNEPFENFFDDEFCRSKRYKDLKNLYELRKQTNISPTHVSYGGSWETQAIRFLGEVNKLNLPAFPRMHHKFLLFCNNTIEPYAVWTGSFNFTLNGTNSLENGIFINDKQIAQAYWYEYLFNFVRSQSLDWEFDYENEIRIGT